MTVIRRCIRCGAVDRGMDMWGVEHARSCSGPVLDEDEARTLLQHKGAVEALERYGFHHGDCPAILVEDPGPCGCGWSDTAASLHLFGGQ